MEDIASQLDGIIPVTILSVEYACVCLERLVTGVVNEDPPRPDDVKQRALRQEIKVFISHKKHS